MKQTLILIPTAGRWSKQVTLGHFRKYKMLDRVRLVVPAKQEDRYRSYVGDSVKIVAEPPEHTGISHTRAWILEKLTRELGHERVLMMDDDMDFCYRPKVGEPKLLTIERGEHFERMLDTLDGWMQDGFVHVGLSARQGNNRPFYNDDKVMGLHPWRDATRMMNFYQYDVTALRLAKVRLGRVPVMEDFDLTLQLLRKGLPNRVSFEFCWNQRGSGATGGCSTYRTPDVQSQAAHRLAELHPDFVVVTTKRSKDTSAAWSGMKERADVTVQWRAAYDSSKEAKS